MRQCWRIVKLKPDVGKMAERESKRDKEEERCPCSGNERKIEMDKNASEEKEVGREEVKEVSYACDNEGAVRVIVGKRGPGVKEGGLWLQNSQKLKLRLAKKRECSR